LFDYYVDIYTSPTLHVSPRHWKRNVFVLNLVFEAFSLYCQTRTRIIRKVFRPANGPRTTIHPRITHFPHLVRTFVAVGPDASLKCASHAGKSANYSNFSSFLHFSFRIATSTTLFVIFVTKSLLKKHEALLAQHVVHTVLCNGRVQRFVRGHSIILRYVKFRNLANRLSLSVVRRCWISCISQARVRLRIQLSLVFCRPKIDL